MVEYNVRRELLFSIIIGLKATDSAHILCLMRDWLLNLIYTFALKNNILTKKIQLIYLI